MLVRWAVFAAPLLVSGGFFGAIVRANQTEPGPLLALVYLGAICVCVGVVTRGVGVLRQ
jgi:hypothetical protein